MKRKLIMNLQLFGLKPMTTPLFNADGGAGNGGAGTGAEGGNGEGEAAEGTGSGDKSFDDVLKDKSYQSEFDKRVAKALATAQAKWETDYQTKIEEAKTEAEKIAKMNADQKSKYAEEKRLSELEKREKEITARELKSTAVDILSEKNLPKELMEVLNYNNAEDCNKSIEAIEKAWNKSQGTWQEAIEREVNKKLRGTDTPKDGKGGANTSGFGFSFTGVRSKK